MQYIKSSEVGKVSSLEAAFEEDRAIGGLGTPNLDRQIELDSGLGKWFVNELKRRDGSPPKKFSIFGHTYNLTEE